jgi:hypothetical protein
MEDILTRWREAEWTLETLPAGSLEAARLSAEIAALRDQYQRVAADQGDQERVPQPYLPET